MVTMVFTSHTPKSSSAASVSSPKSGKLEGMCEGKPFFYAEVKVHREAHVRMHTYMHTLCPPTRAPRPPENPHVSKFCGDTDTQGPLGVSKSDTDTRNRPFPTKAESLP